MRRGDKGRAVPAGRQEGEVYAVLLAGGEGKRLWPLSRSEKPKSFLKIANRKPFLESTIDRLEGFVDKKHIFIVAHASHRKILSGFTKGIPGKNILLEPLKKNTAAAAGFAATRLGADDIALVLPADHVIKNRRAFLETLKTGVSFVREEKNAILCVGASPDAPRTGFGYIKLGRKKAPRVFSVHKFIEKPARKKAEAMLKEGGFLWNTGIFIFKARTILSSMKKYAPRTYANLIAIKKGASPGRAYSRMEDKSIDYQVIEKAKNLYCIRGDFDWSDVGNWLSVAGMEPKARDKNGNFCFGPVRQDGTRGSVIYNATDDLLIVSGLKDMIVAHAGGRTLICGKADAERVKEIAAFFAGRK